jgi:CHASE2 domain-containing sensor protein
MIETSSDWGDLQKLGPHRISTLPRYWITRLYVALCTLVSIAVTWLEPESIAHRLVDATGGQGWPLIAMLAGVACLAIVDVLVNDLLPLRFTFLRAKRHRHLIYAALSMGIFSLSYVILVGAGGWRPLVLPYWLNGGVAAAVAFLDLFQRHRARASQ